MKLTQNQKSQEKPQRFLLTLVRRYRQLEHLTKMVVIALEHFHPISTSDPLLQRISLNFDTSKLE